MRTIPIRWNNSHAYDKALIINFVRTAMYTSLSTEKREIRVLRIHPASNPSDDIECTLATVSLQEYPVYDALSYVWGDANITETISVDGEPFEATTTSLPD
ncbi:hypothetical protein DL98DRAFT_591187 [Cadophora sp. DSE1049]|nr:hypothetical protein DL98DRAFT_591187 [Cadophora sp. DSE1049]